MYAIGPLVLDSGHFDFCVSFFNFCNLVFCARFHVNKQPPYGQFAPDFVWKTHFGCKLRTIRTLVQVVAPEHEVHEKRCIRSEVSRARFLKIQSVEMANIYPICRDLITKPLELKKGGRGQNPLILTCLKPTGWLNDNVIHELMKQLGKLTAYNTGNVLVLNSYFFENNIKDFDRRFGNEQMREQTIRSFIIQLRQSGLSIDNLKGVAIAHHDSETNNHWHVMLLNILNDRVEIFDSCQGAPSRYLTASQRLVDWWAFVYSESQGFRNVFSIVEKIFQTDCKGSYDAFLKRLGVISVEKQRTMVSENGLESIYGLARAGHALRDLTKDLHILMPQLSLVDALQEFEIQRTLASHQWKLRVRACPQQVDGFSCGTPRQVLMFAPCFCL